MDAKGVPFTMKLVKLMAAMGSFALAVASAESYKVRFATPVTVNGTKLKPGDYKIEMNGNEAVLKYDGKTLKVPATLEKRYQTYSETTVEALGNVLKKIHLAGTELTIVFDGGTAVAAGSQ